MVQNGQKTRFLDFLRKFLDSLTFCEDWRLDAWQKFCPQVIIENVSFPMRFQYSLIINISLIDDHLTLIFGT